MCKRSSSRTGRAPRPAVAPGICYGRLDVGLAESAAEAAARLRPLLPGTFALHASPLARARLLAEELGTPRLDARLQEMHFGAWEGRSFEAIGAAIDAWAADPLGFRAPGGESAQEMARRVLHWLDEQLAAAPAQPLVVVANGRTVFEGRIEKSVATLMKWASRDNDRTMLFSTELKIAIR